MSGTQNTHEPTDTRPIDVLIRRTRRLLRLSWMATGLGLGAGLAVGVLVAVTALDLAQPLGEILRLLGLLAVAVPAAWVFLTRVLAPMTRRLAVGQVARRIERHIPGIHNRVVSCIDLTSRKPSPIVSAAFYRRLVQEAIERIRGFRARSVIDVQQLRRASFFAALSLGAFLLEGILFADRLPTALARVFSPFADIPPASGVVYTVTPGDANILRGEDIVFAANVEKGEADRLRLEVRGEADAVLWYDLQKRDGRSWQVVLHSGAMGPGFENSFRYRVHGGGTWSKEYHIALLDRPALVGLHTVLHYPEYMGLPEPQIGAPENPDVTGPEQSTVDVVVQTEGDVATAEIQCFHTEKDSAPFVTFPMHALGDGSWSGSFPLRGEGWYGVVLRNELGYANPPMKEGKFVAVPDQAPQVALERPGANLSLSEPSKVPVVIVASDDYGLADVHLLWRLGDKDVPLRQVVKHYDLPQRADTCVTMLDVKELGLRPGDQIRYRAEAVDRKGQHTQTQEFLIDLTEDKNAADAALRSFEKSQEMFRQRLSNLIADQAQVRDALAKLDQQSTPPKDAVQGAEPQTPAEGTKPLQDVRHELSELTKHEQRNARQAKQMANDLNDAAKQASQLPLLPPQLAEHMQALGKKFEQKAVQPLNDLAARLNQAKNARHPDPDLNAMSRQSQRVQKDLESLQESVRGLADAQKQLKENAQAALNNLRKDSQRQEARQAARDLEELREFIKERMQELKRLEEAQAGLINANQKAADAQRPPIEKQQTQLEKEAEKPLAQARELRDTKSAKKMSKPARNTSSENTPKKSKSAQEATATKAPGAANKNKSGEDSAKTAAAQKSPGKGKSQEQAFSQSQKALSDRQDREMQELTSARQGLASEQESLESMLQQLDQTSRQQPSRGKAAGSEPSELKQMLDSPSMQQAMQMLARMQQMGRVEMPSNSNQRAGARGNQEGGPASGGGVEGDLSKFDVTTRKAILKMQPRLREELLQGLREQGPEGYDKLIQDYFKRLSQGSKRP